MTIREDFSKIFSTETQNKTKNFFFYIAAWCNGEKHFCLIFPENLLFACEGEERVLGQEDRRFAMVCEHRRNPEPLNPTRACPVRFAYRATHALWSGAGELLCFARTATRLLCKNIIRDKSLTCRSGSLKDHSRLNVAMTIRRHHFLLSTFSMENSRDDRMRLFMWHFKGFLNSNLNV